MRLYLASETPGVMWTDTAVYVAVATELLGAVEAELVRDVSVYPSPASEVLNVVTADATYKVTGASRMLQAKYGATQMVLSAVLLDKFR